MIVVADTTPLCHLHWIGLDWLLPEFFHQIYIPQAVAAELRSQGAPAVVRNWMREPPAWLVIVPNPQFPETVAGFTNLDSGELSALSLALSLPAELVIVDDHDGRTAAQRLGFPITGTFGLLERAARLRLIDFDASVRNLLGTGFWAGDAVLEAIRERLRAKR